MVINHSLPRKLARIIHEGSSPVTRCAKRQCGAHWKAHALCFHDYRQPQQKIVACGQL